ncbi:MAG TPA: DUF448 domain-containing protein [Polyangia bacterium]
MSTASQPVSSLGTSAPAEAATAPLRTPARIPERTCVGCRTAGPVTSLVRLGLVSGAIQVWAGRQRPAGRGAWIHPHVKCVQAACKTRAFGRAFRGSVGPVDATALLALVTAARRQQP